MSSAATTSSTNFPAVAALNRRYFLDYPAEVARRLEQLDPSDASPAFAGQQLDALVPVWDRLMPQAGAALLETLERATALDVLAQMHPNRALQLLGTMERGEREAWMEELPAAVGRELRRLMAYPDHSAGRLMDTRIAPFRADTTAGEAIEILRRTPAKTAHSLFLIDDNESLVGRAAIQELAVADSATPLREFMRPVAATVDAFTDEDEIAEILDSYKLYDLPVVDLDGRIIGMVYHATLVDTLQETTGADLQTMVGASRDERALSPAHFAVRKRLPWLLINLVTAFMAAAVVGLFEETIAAFTALAVLLPVVAGQSGNAGSQALAVTIRGLALREISVRDWVRVSRKEVITGLTNGIAVAVVCGLGVYVWSGSLGLVVVIATSMVLAMVAAGFAGAAVPALLTRLGQDPAQSSSIVLTTVTDIAGFFSFLGIATLLAAFL